MQRIKLKRAYCRDVETAPPRTQLAAHAPRTTLCSLIFSLFVSKTLRHVHTYKTMNAACRAMEKLQDKLLKMFGRELDYGSALLSCCAAGCAPCAALLVRIICSCISNRLAVTLTRPRAHR